MARAQKTTLLAFLLLTCSASRLWAEDHPKPAVAVTNKEAEDLVYKALEAKYKWSKLPGFGLAEYTFDYYPDFYFFEATRDNPIGSVILGHFAVNKITADVWEAIGCQRFHSRAIQAQQEKFSRWSGLGNDKLNELERNAPCGE